MPHPDSDNSSGLIPKTNAPAPKQEAENISPLSKDPPFTRVEGDISRGFLILCDHASNHIPQKYENLGLNSSELKRHIAYDIGAAGVTQHLAEFLGAPALLTKFSRLLIDPNRGDDDPTLVMKLSDGAIIPGNRYIDEKETDFRLRNYYRPYHHAIHETLQSAMREGVYPAIISIHSYTDRWKGAERQWHAGILWDSDDRLPEFMINRLRTKTDYIIGNNQPYSGKLANDTMYCHGTSNGLAHALVEIRQDLIQTRQDQKQWARLLADILLETRQSEELKNDIFQIKHFPSNTKKVNYSAKS